MSPRPMCILAAMLSVIVAPLTDPAFAIGCAIGLAVSSIVARD